MQTDVQEYQYSPLFDDEIRLLDFTDSSGLNFLLTKHSLRSAPNYITLSYRWSEAANNLITIDGRSFKVGQNLYEALKSLAAQVRAEESLFWVDAICINQKNVPERNRQVKLMKEIYELSDRVFSWLGMPDDVGQMKLAIDLMGRMRTSLETAWKTGGEDQAAIQNLATVDHFAFPAKTPNEVAKAWKGIHKIFVSSYWKRTWIYQEATTPISINFFVGKLNFSGLDIYPVFFFASAFQQLSSEHRQLLGTISSGCFADQMYQARLARSRSVPRRLFDLLYEIKSTEATDPRDKVYACLAHASDATNAPQIQIDYDRPVVDTYIDVVRFALANWQVSPLEFLGFVRTLTPDSKQKFDTAMPSWLPDWRQQGLTSHITALNIDRTSLYDPCPGTTVDVQISGNELHVRGTTSAQLEITFLSKSWWQTHSSSRFKPLTSMFFEPGGMAEGTEEHQKDLMKLFGRAVVLDRTYKPGYPTNTSENDHWLSTYVRGGMVDWALANADPATLSLRDQIRRDTEYELIQAGFVGRRLGWMGSEENGHCGLFPDATQVGDLVAMFYGGKSLYVVRRATGTAASVYQFIGECYVDGAMDGQLLQICRSELVSEEVMRVV